MMHDLTRQAERRRFGGLLKPTTNELIAFSDRLSGHAYHVFSQQYAPRACAQLNATCYQQGDALYSNPVYYIIRPVAVAEVMAVRQRYLDDERSMDFPYRLADGFWHEVGGD